MTINFLLQFSKVTSCTHTFDPMHSNTLRRFQLSAITKSYIGLEGQRILEQILAPSTQDFNLFCLISWSKAKQVSDGTEIMFPLVQLDYHNIPQRLVIVLEHVNHQFMLSC